MMIRHRGQKGGDSPDDLHRAFGARVKYLRLRIGLSQEEFAGNCGLDRTYVGGIERGERNPSLRNIIKIALTLNVSLSSLFKDDDASEET